MSVRLRCDRAYATTSSSPISMPMAAAERWRRSASSSSSSKPPARLVPPPKSASRPLQVSTLASTSGGPVANASKVSTQRRASRPRPRNHHGRMSAPTSRNPASASSVATQLSAAARLSCSASSWSSHASWSKRADPGLGTLGQPDAPPTMRPTAPNPAHPSRRGDRARSHGSTRACGTGRSGRSSSATTSDLSTRRVTMSNASAPHMTVAASLVKPPANTDS